MTTGNTDEDILTMKDMIANYLAIARRGLKYWKRGTALFLLISAVGGYWAFTRPRNYRSETTFQVQEPDVPGGEQRGDEEIQRSLDARAGQVYGSRSNILEIVGEMHLYPQMRGRVTVDKIVDQFYGSFEKRVDHDTLHLGFSYGDPEMAQRVVQRLIRLFTEQRQNAVEARARQSLDTVTSQLVQLEATLSSQEDALDRFTTANQALVDQIRARHMGALGLPPGLVPQRPVVNDPTASAGTRRLRSRLSQLRSQLDHLQHPLSAPPPGEEPVAIQTIEHSLAEARDQLAQLRARGYTDQYPAVQTTQSRVNELQGQLASERARWHTTAVDPSTMSQAQITAQIDQVQRDISDTSTALARSEANDQGALSPITPDAGTSQVHRPDALTNINDVEQQYDRLNTDLSTTRTQYQALLQQKYTRQADLRRVQVAGGEQIRMIDPPSLPLEPEPPGKTKLGSIVLAIAMVLGAGTSLISGFIDTRVYDLGDLRRWGEVPDLPFVPDLHADAPVSPSLRPPPSGPAGPSGPPGPYGQRGASQGPA